MALAKLAAVAFRGEATDRGDVRVTVLSTVIGSDFLWAEGPNVDE
jgi:hypothetical protein